VKATIPVDHCVSDAAEAPEQHRDVVADFLENPVRMLVWKYVIMFLHDLAFISLFQLDAA
jgi:hypothetical protein